MVCDFVCRIYSAPLGEIADGNAWVRVIALDIGFLP